MKLRAALVFSLLAAPAFGQHRTGGMSLSGVHEDEPADLIADPVQPSTGPAAIGAEAAESAEGAGLGDKKDDAKAEVLPELGEKPLLGPAPAFPAPVSAPASPAPAPRVVPAPAAPAPAPAGQGQYTPEEIRNCTGDNPRCKCVKKDNRYNKYENHAATAIARAFPGQDEVPPGMTHEQATKAICAVYNAHKTLGPRSACRAQADEIVLEDPAAPDPAYPTISLDVVTSAGKFWRNAIAACQRGVQ